MNYWRGYDCADWGIRVVDGKRGRMGLFRLEADGGGQCIEFDARGLGMRGGFLVKNLGRGGGFLGQGPPAALGLLGGKSGGHRERERDATRGGIDDDQTEKRDR
jgi:hypothetical protein